MKRRTFLLGTGAAALGATAVLRESNEGGAYSPYFSTLNKALQSNGLARPNMVVDLDNDGVYDAGHDVLVTNGELGSAFCVFPPVPALGGVAMGAVSIGILSYGAVALGVFAYGLETLN